MNNIIITDDRLAVNLKITEEIKKISEKLKEIYEKEKKLKARSKELYVYG